MQLSAIQSMVNPHNSIVLTLGSSNLDAGVSVGTIFGIYRIPESSVDNPTVEAVLRPGTDMVVAGYCMSRNGCPDYRHVRGEREFGSHYWEWSEWVYIGQCTWGIHPDSS
jgi:hypothetical protein